MAVKFTFRYWKSSAGNLIGYVTSMPNVSAQASTLEELKERLIEGMELMNQALEKLETNRNAFHRITQFETDSILLSA